MVLFPLSAAPGINNPKLLTPVPVHVPPGVAAVKVTAGSVEQNGPAGVIAAFGTEFTTIVDELDELQEPNVTV
jgi:hypothetical protein